MILKFDSKNLILKTDQTFFDLSNRSSSLLKNSIKENEIINKMSSAIFTLSFRVKQQLEGKFLCIEVKEPGKKQRPGAPADNEIIVTGDVPTLCPFLVVSGEFQRISSKCFKLQQTHEIKKVKLSKQKMYELLGKRSSKRI